MVVEGPLVPENGFDAVGVAALSAGRADRRPPMLSATCRCCRRSASLSTMTPGVAELRAPGVFDSDAGLCLSFSLSCCLGAGVSAAPDMLSLSLGCGGSSTLAFIAASFALKVS